MSYLFKNIGQTVDLCVDRENIFRRWGGGFPRADFVCYVNLISMNGGGAILDPLPLFIRARDCCSRNQVGFESLIYFKHSVEPGVQI